MGLSGGGGSGRCSWLLTGCLHCCVWETSNVQFRLREAGLVHRFDPLKGTCNSLGIPVSNIVRSSSQLSSSWILKEKATFWELCMEWAAEAAEGEPRWKLSFTKNGVRTSGATWGNCWTTYFGAKNKIQQALYNLNHLEISSGWVSLQPEQVLIT